MSNREVAGLQALAKKHGGELTVNPDTGLPEAGFLDSLLPAIAGAGLTYFSGGAITPMMSAGIVGGISALDSKDLGKGLMAGLGAYGGGSMVGGLAGMGLADGAATATTPASEAAMQAAKGEAYQNAVGKGASNFGSMFANKPMDAIASFGGGSGLNAAKNVFAAAAPAIMADQNVKTTTPSPNRGMIRPQTFSRQQTYPQQEYAGPVSGERRYFNDYYTAGDPYAAANGGLVALARGGYAQQPLFKPTTPLPANNMYGASRTAYDYLMGLNPTSGGQPYDPNRPFPLQPSIPEQGMQPDPNKPKKGTGHYEFDPITGQYKWIPDPITPVDIAPPVFQPATPIGGGGGQGRPVDHNPEWTGKTDAEKTEYYAQHPIESGLASGVANYLSNGFFGALGKAQDYFSPGFTQRNMNILQGIHPPADSPLAGGPLGTGYDPVTGVPTYGAVDTEPVTENKADAESVPFSTSILSQYPSSPDLAPVALNKLDGTVDNEFSSDRSFDMMKEAGIGDFERAQFAKENAQRSGIAALSNSYGGLGSSWQGLVDRNGDPVLTSQGLAEKNFLSDPSNIAAANKIAAINYSSPLVDPSQRSDYAPNPSFFGKTVPTNDQDAGESDAKAMAAENQSLLNRYAVPAETTTVPTVGFFDSMFGPRVQVASLDNGVTSDAGVGFNPFASTTESTTETAPAESTMTDPAQAGIAALAQAQERAEAAAAQAQADREQAGREAARQAEAAAQARAEAQAQADREQAGREAARQAESQAAAAAAAQAASQNYSNEGRNAPAPSAPSDGGNYSNEGRNAPAPSPPMGANASPSDGSAPPSGDRGGGGGGGGRVICTHFYRKGEMSRDMWRSDLEFTFKNLSPTTVRGYQYWAIPYVKLMRKSKLAENIMRPLAMHRAKELSYQMGRSSKGSLFGKAVRLIGEPICFTVGLFVGEQNWQSLWNPAKD
jgi:hypothetical protein